MCNTGVLELEYFFPVSPQKHVAGFTKLTIANWSNSLLIEHPLCDREVVRSIPSRAVPKTFNSFPISGHFCCLLITFANSLDPDQAQQNVGPDLDPSYLTQMVFLKDFLEKVYFKKNPQTKKHAKLPRMQKVKMVLATVLLGAQQ